ncbi:MAG: hypothetical protein GY774_12150 [Planctomycetes bacterium]|nr:hypothetical protein [Planctomycetota bacterium]|tara:strand:+ start:54 stop:368 length:315 start_codon:yes stop_codon:yes gene_type:complete
MKSPESTSRPASPDDIIVKDKTSFRRWCNAMHLNPRQASSVLMISSAMIYKYIDLSQKNEVRQITALCCNLISAKPSDERMAWVKETLDKSGCHDAWPSSNPIS